VQTFEFQNNEFAHRVSGDDAVDGEAERLSRFNKRLKAASLSQVHVSK